MKKIILTATMALCTVGLFAQNSGSSSSSSGMMSKKGEMYLPESGDWAISFDATPWLNYFGRFFTAGNSAPYANWLNSSTQTIVGKYYVDAQTAYRGLLRIGINSTSQQMLIDQDYTTSPSLPPATVTDKMSTSNHFIGLGAGMEKRRGHTRLQGYYGAELMFWLSGSSSKFTYGNAYSNANDPSAAGLSWYDFTNFKGTGVGTVAGLPRPTELDNGSTFGISLQGFAGFEYFFMPKISVGAEYTWGINFSSTGATQTKVEEMNLAGNATQVDTYTTVGKSSRFSLDDGINTAWGNSSGSLYIHFHF